MSQKDEVNAKNVVSVLFSLFIIVAQPQFAKAADGSKPNIVFILMENLGYGELSCYGGGIIRGAATPRIDKLATEGTRLTNSTARPKLISTRLGSLTTSRS